MSDENGNHNKLRQSNLNKVLDKIILKKQDKCCKTFEAVLTDFTTCMKSNDPLFRYMFKRVVYTGSYYEKLRIKDACEFDINLLLELPVKLDTSPKPPSYALLMLDKKVEDLPLGDAEKRALKDLLGKDNYVSPKKVLSWMQSVVDKAVPTFKKPPEVKSIRFTASGPARTLLFILTDDTEISVDLVPVFRFPYKDWPKHIKNVRQAILSKVSDEKKQLYLVPKVYKAGVKQSPHEPSKQHVDLIWRMHFADIEKVFLTSHFNARPVVMLLKLLRDSQKWFGLHSYFLKTLVLRDLSEKPKKKWDRNLLSERLLEMMESLKECLDKKNLPHFFFETVNLLQFMNECELRGMSNRLGKILEKIKTDPETVKTYFVTC